MLLQSLKELKMSGAARLCMPGANPVEVGAAIVHSTEQLIRDAGYGGACGEAVDDDDEIARAAAHAAEQYFDYDDYDDYDDGGGNGTYQTEQMYDEEDFEHAQAPTTHPWLQAKA
jgi:hypothetical protein